MILGQVGRRMGFSDSVTLMTYDSTDDPRYSVEIEPLHELCGNMENG